MKEVECPVCKEVFVLEESSDSSMSNDFEDFVYEEDEQGKEKAVFMMKERECVLLEVKRLASEIMSINKDLAITETILKEKEHELSKRQAHIKHLEAVISDLQD